MINERCAPERPAETLLTEFILRLWFLLSHSLLNVISPSPIFLPLSLPLCFVLIPAATLFVFPLPLTVSLRTYTNLFQRKVKVSFELVS